MDNPRNRARPPVKSPLRYKGRSKSAHTFKDSPFYDKFLFFENIKDGVTRASSSINIDINNPLTDIPQLSSPNEHTKGSVFAECRSYQPVSIHQSFNPVAPLTKEHSSKLHISHGQLSDLELVSSESSSEQFRDSTHWQVPHSQGAFIPPYYPKRNRFRCSDVARSCSIHQLRQSNIVSDRLLSFANNPHGQHKPSIHKNPENNLLPSLASASIEASKGAFTGSDYIPNRSLPLPEFQNSLDASSNVNIRKMETDASLNITTRTAGACSRWSGDESLRCSSSARDSLEITTKKEKYSKEYVSDSSLNVLAASVTCTSPQTDESHLETFKNPLNIPATSISTAKITLTNSGLAQQKIDRKIQVIETRHSKPHVTKGTCPRLNEWLSSVMKLQKENAHNEDWAFPEDDHVVSPSQPSLHPICLNETENEIMSTPTQTMSTKQGIDIDKSTHKQCSTKAINTDLSFASENIQLNSFIGSCVDPSILSKLCPADKKVEEFENEIIGYRTPSRCSCCCAFNTGEKHSDVNTQNFSINNNKTYQPIVHTDQKYETVCFADNDSRSSINTIQGQLTARVPLQCRSHKLANKTSDKPHATPFYYSDYHGSDIAVQVADNKDCAAERYRASIYSKSSLNRDMPVSRNSQKFRSTHDPVERSYVPRGVSPHYMFPISHPAWEEDDVSRFLASPRNSVGSISSVLSYKSSNADSAVDLGPPDDEQDFEYADFLVKYQSRRCSHANENLLHMEKQTIEDSITNYQLEGHSFDNSAFLCLQAVGRSLQGSSSRGAGTKADQDPPSIADYNMFNHLENESLDSPVCRDSSLLSRNLVSSIERTIRPHPHTETVVSDNFFLESSHKNCCSKTGPFFSKTKTLTDNANPDAFQHQSFQEIRVFGKEDKTATTSHSSVELDFQTLQQQTLKMHCNEEQPQKYIIPELIISDHSDDINNSEENSPTSQLGNQYVDLDSPLPSRPGSSMSSLEQEVLEVEENGFLRSMSVSSLCSIASTCSTCTAVSDTDVVIPVKKQSSWKKIRSFILWSPFIQVFKKHRYPWIQLAGHQGNFHAGEAGSVLKKLDTRELASFQKLMTDTLRDFVPEYRGDVEKNGETYIQLQDLLCAFSHPCVMDVKMGIRTYLEDELQKARRSPTLRKDMYQKMVEIDCTAPTSDEHEQKAVTKPRYMQWRDEMSSSVELGFRVEGIKKSDGNSSKDFKKTKTRDSIVDIMRSFVGTNENIVTKYINRLKELMQTQETSEFFLSHEVIGSSLLFVHDADENVGVWMIDFGKSEPLPKGVNIDHRSTWQEGNHEDGYLFGLDNLITVLEEVQRTLTSSSV